MTVSTQIIKRTYSANGINRSWEVDFPLASRTDLHVWIISPEGLQQEVEDFDLNAAGTLVEYPTDSSEQNPLQTGWKISLIRRTPLTQEIDLLRHGMLDAEVLESGYDKLTLISQELEEKTLQNSTAILGNSTALAAETMARETAVSNEATARQNADSALQNALTSGLAAKLDATTAATTYLAKTDATDTYLTQTNAASTYLSQTDAASTYLSQANASSTYLTQTSAASTYATQNALTTGLAGKQDTLTTAQAAAANSGVTSNTVTQVATNTSAITSFVPYIQSAGLYEMKCQTAVDASALLSLTGSVHALDLDLSDNTKLTKLTASGTSGSLANLSSALVSPFAPFNSVTSPQLDISYSSLNRTALVNLFNSMPYNIGYTEVGSPSITDGIISYTSDSDYVQASEQLTWDGASDLEVYCRFKTPATFTDSNMPVISNEPWTTPFVWVWGDSVYFQLPTTNISVSGVTTNTWYRIKIIGKNNTWTRILYADNGTALAQNTSSETTGTALTKPIAIFREYNGNRPVEAVDLNRTYIYLNGVPWFSGKAAMTKTCDVRGCSGTADLTTADKAIVTDKGWSLTVA